MTDRDLVAFSLATSSPLRKAAVLAALAAERPGGDLLPVALDLVGAADDAAVLRARADDILTRARAAGIQATAFGHANYPVRLATLPDAPVVLWTAGTLLPDEPRVVAVVGSRAASEDGLEVAEHLAFDLARAGVTIVSGLARGCDGAAHRGALAAGGRTIAVLGCGPDVCYPREHESLQRAIAASGAVTSELPPGTPPLARHFPLRNRLISGFAHGVVVVEASEQSGSLITAAAALEQGRDVMAVPGPVVGTRHRGCHALLRDGAPLVESASDVFAALGWTAGPASSGPAEAAQAGGGLLDFLRPGDDMDLDALVARSGLAAPDVLSSLTQLELAGAVLRTIGGRYRRRGR